MKPLLHLQISEVMANVRERSWDSSAAISVKDIVIFDHITLGKDFVANGYTMALLFNGHQPTFIEVVLIQRCEIVLEWFCWDHRTCPL